MVTKVFVLQEKSNLGGKWRLYYALCFIFNLWTLEWTEAIIQAGNLIPPEASSARMNQETANFEGQPCGSVRLSQPQIVAYIRHQGKV